MPVGFFMFLSMNDFLPGCLFAVVVIKCFMNGVNVWWVYLAPPNIPRAISVLTLGNKVILYCIVKWCQCWWTYGSLESSEAENFNTTTTTSNPFERSSENKETRTGVQANKHRNNLRIYGLFNWLFENTIKITVIVGRCTSSVSMCPRPGCWTVCGQRCMRRRHGSVRV